ncbi:MAG: hypothetical protein ACHQ06_01085 [Candidatus Dormibacteria bacterium]
MGVSKSRQDTGGRLWFVAAALLALPLCLDATSDPDLWWHLRLGQWIVDNHAVPHTEFFSYTANGAPLVAHEWLSELLFWAVHSAVGLAGLAILLGLATWSGLLALALIARARGASGFVAGVVLLLGAKAMQPITGTRPQMFTFALLCWSLFLLDRHLRRGGRAIWILAPLVLLWANLHAGFAVGLGVVAIAIAGGVLDATWRHRPDPVKLRRLGTATGALLLAAAAALLNPNGVDLYRYALLGSTPAAHQLIQEWQPPNFATLEMLPLALLIVATALSMALNRRRLRPSQVVLAVIGVAAALLAVRNIAIAVALLSPSLAELLPIRYRLPSRRLALPAIALAAGAAIVVTAVVRLSVDTETRALAKRLPVCLLLHLQATNHPVRLWLPYAESGYAVYQAWPQVHVYAYGNDAALGAGVIVDYVRVAAGAVDDPSALQLLRDSNTDAVITPAGRLANELQGAGWTKVAQAHDHTLFVAPALTPMPALTCPGL